MTNLENGQIIWKNMSLETCEHPLVGCDQSWIWIHPWLAPSTTWLQSTELLELLCHLSDQDTATCLWLFSEQIKRSVTTLKASSRDIPIACAAMEQESSDSWDSPMQGMAGCCWNTEPWPVLFPFRLEKMDKGEGPWRQYLCSEYFTSVLLIALV